MASRASAAWVPRGVPGSLGRSGGGPGTACRPAAASVVGRWARRRCRLNDGLAFPLPKGSDLILQAHFHLTGKAETEVSTVGIYFAEKAPERTLMGVQLPAVFGLRQRLAHPRRATKDYIIKDSFTLPVDMRVYSAGAHAHYLAKNMKMVAMLPDGKTQPLLWIPGLGFRLAGSLPSQGSGRAAERHAHRRRDQLRQFQRKSAPAQ